MHADAILCAGALVLDRELAADRAFPDGDDRYDPHPQPSPGHHALQPSAHRRGEGGGARGDGLEGRVQCGAPRLYVHSGFCLLFLRLVSWINPLRTAVPFGGTNHTTVLSSSASPKRDCSPKRVQGAEKSWNVRGEH